jgi:molecular chaperone DnaK
MKIENAVSDLKSVLEKDDKEAIEKKTAALAEASGALAQKLYTEQQAESAGGGENQAESGDDVVDAEFEEVDKDDQSKSA